MRYNTIKERNPNEKWTHAIEGNIQIINEPPYRKIFIGSVMLAEYLIGSKFEEAHALVTLTKNKVASVPTIASAFGIHHKTLYTLISEYDSDGLEGLRPAGHYPGKVNNELIDFICSEQRNNPHLTLTELNRALYKKFELKLSEKTIRKLVESQAIKPLSKEPDGQITFDELFVEASKEDDKTNTLGDYTRYAGYTIFSTMISELFTGIYDYIDSQASIKNSLKTWEAKKLITSFVLYYLMGHFNIEQTKTVNRHEMGCLIGEETAPCAKTLKRNMYDLMLINLPDVVPDMLAQEYIANGYVEIGQLYYDGHFVPYYGKEDIGKGFFTQRRLTVPGHEQFWANDANGRPVFFLNSYGYARFPQAIIELCGKTHRYMSNAGDTRPLMVAFDRGGYSASLFQELTHIGVCWATWKVGETKEQQEDAFTETFLLQTENDESEYGIIFTSHRMTGAKEPFDAAIILNKKTGKQTTILYGIPNNAKDFYQPLDLVKFLLNRWKQENFFKYALKEVDINQTHGLQLGTEEDAYYVPNPEYEDLQVKRVKLERKYASLQSRKEKYEERYFALKNAPSWENYLTQKGYQDILHSLEEASCEMEQTLESLKNTPYSIPYVKKDGSLYTYLDFSRINLMNALKAAVYNMRCRIKDIAKEYFKDHREISKFIDVLTQTGGYYHKGEHLDTVYLNTLETPAYQAAAEKLIKKINQMDPITLGCNGKQLVIKFKT